MSKVKKHSRTLLDTILERAKGSFTLEHSMENFDEWCNHYIKVAREVHAEFVAEGLVMTAAKVQEIIDFNVKYDNVTRLKVKDVA